MMDRDEHLAWAKRRALEYVDAGLPEQAVTSMLSDLRAHEDFRDETTAYRGMIGRADVVSRDPDAIRKWIKGFR